MISAKVIAHSKSAVSATEIATMVVTFPRFILAELNTHRMFSRNSASSRAIPLRRCLKSVWNNPFIPIAWMKDHKGMQGNEYFTNKIICWLLKQLWLSARDMAIVLAWLLSKVGLTKQFCNRLLEPFMWHTVIITATEWENFFYLRCPQYEIGKSNQSDSIIEVKKFRSKKQAIKKWMILNASDKFWQGANKGQAEIHMMALAEAMWDALNESTPALLRAGEWHIPFGTEIDFELSKILSYERYSSFKDQKVKIATAMCARVSYTVVGEEGKEPNFENDIKLHDRLAASGHWSPFEHCAETMGEFQSASDVWSGNFHGFTQYRKMFTNENVTK